MRVFAALVCAAAGLSAQPPDGAKIFRQSCAVGYCHGSGGGPGRAPSLIGRRLDGDYVMKVTRDGLPRTGMPAWDGRLNPDELSAVASYVVRISQGPGYVPVRTGAAALAIPEDAGRGRGLFFDSLRIARCSTCHLVEGKGTAVGPNLAAGSPSAQLIRDGRPGSVRQVRAGDDTFPALLVDQRGDWTRVYDLTVAPPVLRTVHEKTLHWSSGSSWKHAVAVSSYSEADLRAIAGYLQWLSTR
jgi:mono/diheme cytochrome c family protein